MTDSQHDSDVDEMLAKLRNMSPVEDLLAKLADMHHDRPAPSGVPAPSGGGKVSPRNLSWRDNVMTARDLRMKIFPPIKFVVPNLITEGLSLFVGTPKLGKSWLALDICIAATTDRFTLGSIKPLQGDVLYLALEDSFRRVQRRIDKLLPTFTGDWPEHLTFARQWRRVNEGGLEDIKAWCLSVVNPVLVVIDTLAKIRSPSKPGQPTYDADYAALSPLQEFAISRGIAILVISHDRKMGADDPFDTVSGTKGLTGVVDTILLIKRSSAGTVLHSVGRDIEGSETAIQFDKATCRWTLLGAAAEVHRSTAEHRILAALKDAPAQGLSVRDIMIRADLPNRTSADKTLQRMAEQGTIRRVSWGKYSLPEGTVSDLSDLSDLSDDPTTH